jgi:hypothetical protein
MHGREIRLPSSHEAQPDRDRLAERYSQIAARHGAQGVVARWGYQRALPDFLESWFHINLE